MGGGGGQGGAKKTVTPLPKDLPPERDPRVPSTVATSGPPLHGDRFGDRGGGYSLLKSERLPFHDAIGESLAEAVGGSTPAHFFYGSRDDSSKE